MDEMSAEGDLGPDHCMGDYVFSILGTSKRRTLHRIGECWRLPGTHYRNYIVVGPDRPFLGQGEAVQRLLLKSSRTPG